MLTNRITFNVTSKTIDFIVLSVIIERTATFEKIFTFGGGGGGRGGHYFRDLTEAQKINVTFGGGAYFRNNYGNYGNWGEC